MFNLGVVSGLAGDHTAAVHWFHAAAQKGHTTAMFNLGNCLAVGRGVPRDMRLAAQWFSCASDKGNANAMFNLATLLASGDGVAQDVGAARRLFQAAADNGIAHAAAALAALDTSHVAPAPSDGSLVRSTKTHSVGGHHWINERLHPLEFECDIDRREAREWLEKTFKTSTTVALEAIDVVDDIVVAAKVVTVVLRVVIAIVEAHERAMANDGRVVRLCTRLNELRAIMEQMRGFLADEAKKLMSGKAMTSAASALRAPLDRLLEAVKAARDAIDAWQEVSRASGDDLWSGFKRWASRTVNSKKHADLLVEANDELQSALQQIGAVASIRAALNTASSWQEAGADADLKAWLTASAERDQAFRAAMQQDTSEIKQRLASLLPGIDKLLAQHLGAVHDKLDVLLGANIERLPFESFEAVRDLGEGAYGAISAMRCKKLGRAPVAVKKLVLTGNAADDKKRKDRLREEARLMNQFKHQHIVQFYGQVVTPSSELWLVMELLDKSLDKYIAELAGDQSKWPMDDRKRVAHEIALGLEYLHGKGVLHRDLKSPNVMLTAGERQAKLIDFGLSKDTNSAKNKSSTIQGSSSLWMAPEINGNDDFSQASDVYAFGMLLTELVFLELPSGRTLLNVAKRKIEWKDLIQQCTDEERHERPSAAKCAETTKN
jgi:hypothetical protein